MVVDVGIVKNHIKPKADTTLYNTRKVDLIEYIRTLEHNYNVVVSFNENQAKYIESLPVQRWIPVTERLPEPYKQVITLRTYLFSGDSLPVGLEYIRLHGDAQIPMWSRDYATGKTKVTHWMPLPQLPKEG